jgi:hypothetical protein
MPLNDQLLPEAESFTIDDHPTAADTKINLTGIPEIDALLIQVMDAATREKMAAYVYSNLIARPKLTVALNKRAVYTVPNSGGTFEYALTDTDIAWLARSLNGEGGEKCNRTKASALSWTMFNRFMLNPRHFGTTSFWVFLQGFSQPINPEWRSDGKFCRLGGKYYGKKECSASRLQRRADTAFGAIPKQCLNFAEELAVGTLEQPGKVYVDFASYEGMEPYGDNIGGDNFLTVADDAKRYRDNNATPVAWLSGRLAKIGSKTVPTTDVLEVRKRDELLAYLTNYIAGGQRAVLNQTTNKGDINSSASTQAQNAATQKLSQTANAIQMTVAQQNVKVPSFNNQATGEDGNQVGSDTIWNRS